jgi:poly(3-hydroxybutyrate) depolymerase
MYYQFYEMNRAAISPYRALAGATKLFYANPMNPLGQTAFGRSIAAACEVFERATRRYGKPAFDLPETMVDGRQVPVAERVVWRMPFCNLVHFERALPLDRAKDPTILIVAPMSGHYATLLRGTVEALLPHAEVYITDWIDARSVPVSDGSFDLDDYIDYVINMIHHLGPKTHIVAVCQPSVPVLAAASVMAARNDPLQAASMTLMGGPIDTRINPTAVNKLAQGKSLDWFRSNVIMTVPWPQPGFMRAVYPGFLQLSGFMSMNLDRHVTAHQEFFQHLVSNDGDSAEKHREFYDEYMAVMDLTAEFYLQTVDTVFIKHALPQGLMMHRHERVDPGAIRKTALLTVEGENDDISGVGQTMAAQTLCTALPDSMREHHLQPKVGHYGVFNGSRFRKDIAPRIVDFVKRHNVAQTLAFAPKARKAARSQ